MPRAWRSSKFGTQGSGLEEFRTNFCGALRLCTFGFPVPNEPEDKHRYASKHQIDAPGMAGFPVMSSPLSLNTCSGGKFARLNPLNQACHSWLRICGDGGFSVGKRMAQNVQPTISFLCFCDKPSNMVQPPKPAGVFVTKIQRTDARRIRATESARRPSTTSRPTRWGRR